MEKALFALVLLSYLQAFTDGNKRVARITANALLEARNLLAQTIICFL